jgi:hypothetical protein
MFRRPRKEQIGIDRLRRFWDGLVHGNAPRATEVELEPAVIETVYAIHAQDTVPPVDPAFVDRLLGELLGQPDPATLPHVTPVEAGGSTPHQSNGRAAPLPARMLVELEGGTDPVPRPQENKMTASNSVIRPPSLAVVPRPTGVRSVERRPPHQALGVLATAALVLLTLAGGYVAFVRGPSDPGIPTAGPFAAVPAAQEASPVAPADELIVEAAFPGLALPAGDAHASLAFITVVPGDGGDYPAVSIGATASILLVWSGTMAIAGDSVSVHRAAGTSPAAVAASAATGETLLGPGDAAVFVLGPNRSYAVRNPGAEPLVVVEAWIVSGPFPYVNPQPEFAHGNYRISPRVATLPADATVTMRLTRATLVPEATRSPAEGSWQVAVAELPGLSQRSHGEVGNGTQEPLEIVVLTAEFDPVAATPVP